jgi:hypothetical protein
MVYQQLIGPKKLLRSFQYKVRNKKYMGGHSSESTQHLAINNPLK